MMRHIIRLLKFQLYMYLARNSEQIKRHTISSCLIRGRLSIIKKNINLSAEIRRYDTF